MRAKAPVSDIAGDAGVRSSGATAPIPGLVTAFRIHADGSPESLPVDQPIALSHDGLLWLHFNLADVRALQWLTSANLQVPPQAGSLLLSKDTYQHVHTLDRCVYGVISDLRREIGEATEDTGHLRFIMTEQLLVSGRHHALCAVDATRRALEGGQRIESVAALFETIVENVADTMDQVADRVAHNLDELEEQVLADTATDLRQSLGRLRRTCVRLHRQLSGLRIIFHRLEQRSPGNLKPALQFRAGKLAQRLDDLDHTIVEMRERSRLLQEELHLKIEEQGNNNIRVLSIMTALLLPPTLVTGVFGMNIKGLPFTDFEAAFLGTALLMALASLVAYFLMKRIGVIR
ncbi:MAG: transporter [Bradyrhizobium sp.]|nr:transporter [Bradyrhizobium sp.]